MGEKRRFWRHDAPVMGEAATVSTSPARSRAGGVPALETDVVDSGGVERLPLAVYDGLRAGESGWMRLLRDKTVSERPGRAVDQVLYAQGLPFAVDQAGATIVVDVMTPRPEIYEKTLAAIDDMQLYKEGTRPTLYVRVRRHVLCRGDTEPIWCWLYQAAPCIRAHLHADEVVASGDWLNLLLAPTRAARPSSAAGSSSPSRTAGRRASELDAPESTVGRDARLADLLGRDLRGPARSRGSATARVRSATGNAPRPTGGAASGLPPAPRRTWYFAFGSNLSKEQMERRTGPIIERVPAHVDGWALTFNKEASGGEVGFANIVRVTGQRVEGLLYRVDDEGMRRLDNAEGVTTKHYLRVEMPVTRDDTGQAVPAVVYLAHPLRVVEGLRPGQGYMERLLAGAEWLSDAYVAALRAVETVPDPPPSERSVRPDALGSAPRVMNLDDAESWTQKRLPLPDTVDPIDPDASTADAPDDDEDPDRLARVRRAVETGSLVDDHHDDFTLEELIAAGLPMEDLDAIADVVVPSSDPFDQGMSLSLSARAPGIHDIPLSVSCDADW